MDIKSLFVNHGMTIAFAAVAAITAGAALIWSKHPVRWILFLLAIGLFYAVLVLFEPDALDLDPQLPGEFYGWLRPWLLGLGLVVLLGVPHLIGEIYRGRRGATGAGDAEASRFPDLESAWGEILNRLSQARYDPANQGLFLLLSADESLPADLIRASGANLFAAAPTAPEAPIHAYASADGLFVSCAGASAWGAGDGEGTARLEFLCRKIADLNPEQPTLRGIAVLFPRETAAAPEALKRVGPLRNDLQAIQGGLKVRCPVIAVFCTRDPASGFVEFAARMPSNARNSRCGFSTPTTPAFDRNVADRGLRWFSQWLQSWSLNLMVQDYVDVEGNSRLVEMNAEARRDLPALCTLVETAFSTHARSQPVMVRGCYFAVVGPEPGDFAFAAGLVRGPRSKMIADAPLTSWAREADALDRNYRLMALGIGLAAAALALPVWLLRVVPWLSGAPGDPNGLRWLGWAGLGLLGTAWAAGLLYPRLRKPAAKASAS